MINKIMLTSTFCFEKMKMSGKFIVFILASIIFMGNDLTLLSQSPDNHDLVKKKMTTCSEGVEVFLDRELYISGESIYFKMQVFKNKESGLGVLSRFGYIVFRGTDGIIFKSAVEFENNIAFSTIQIPDTLKSGVYQVMCFTNLMRNYGEHNYCYKNVLIINRFDKLLTEFYTFKFKNTNSGNQYINQTFDKESDCPISVNLQKNAYRVHEKVKINVVSDNPELEGKIISACISVKEINPLMKPDNLTIPLINYSFQSNDSINRIGEEDVFMQEINGIGLSGKLMNGENPVRKECIFISVTDSLPNLEYTFTNKRGRFNFILSDYYLGKSVLLKLKDNSDQKSGYEFILDNKFNLSSSYNPELPSMTPELKKYILKCQDIVQINKAYQLTKSETGNKIKKILYPYVYRSYTSAVIPSKYVPLDNFREIVSNLVQGIKMAKFEDKYQIFVFDFITKSYFNNQAIVFLDGVPIDDINQITWMNSNDIEKIEICNLVKVKGLLNFAGIVAIFSKNKSINNIQFLKPYKRIKTDLVLPSVSFKTPEYNNVSQNSLADFRQLLYWNPDIKLDFNKSVELDFFTSDYLTEYIVEVYGITSDGKKIRGFSKFQVSK